MCVTFVKKVEAANAVIVYIQDLREIVGHNFGHEIELVESIETLRTTFNKFSTRYLDSINKGFRICPECGEEVL